MSVEGLQNLRFELGSLFAKTIPEKQHDAVKMIALQCFSKVVAKTPVDTGRARANWSVTVNRPSTASTEAIDKAPFGTPPVNTVAATIAADGSKPSDTIYITNALPYILPLEDGHSKQGAHMVELTVNEIKSHYGI